MLTVFFCILRVSAVKSFYAFGGVFPHIRRNHIGILHAADTREQYAARVSFRWHQPSQPLYKSANSADLADVLACHFGG